jgi:hypothetical protein
MGELTTSDENNSEQMFVAKTEELAAREVEDLSPLFTDGQGATNWRSCSPPTSGRYARPSAFSPIRD